MNICKPVELTVLLVLVNSFAGLFNSKALAVLNAFRSQHENNEWISPLPEASGRGFIFLAQMSENLCRHERAFLASRLVLKNSVVAICSVTIGT